MANERSNVHHAAGVIQGNPAAILAQDGGISGVVRNGAGDYSITLQEQIDALECVVTVTVRGATPLEASVVHTSDAVKQVLLLSNAGAATDGNFDFVIHRIAP